MSGINTWAVTVCIAALCAAVMNILSPTGEMKKIFGYILGVFLLCAVILPIKDVKLDNFSFELKGEGTELSEKIASDIEDITNQSLRDGVVSLVQNELLKFQIDNAKTEIIMDIGEDNCISITKAIIYIKRTDVQYKQKIISAVENNLGIKTEVYLTEE